MDYKQITVIEYITWMIQYFKSEKGSDVESYMFDRADAIECLLVKFGCERDEIEGYIKQARIQSKSK